MTITCAPTGTTSTGPCPARADALGTAYDLSSAGHWYGRGENSDRTVQPWPLDSGLRVDTDEPMDVRVNSGGSGLGEFTVTGDRTAACTVFVEDTPAEVYRDHIELVKASADFVGLPALGLGRGCS